TRTIRNAVAAPTPAVQSSVSIRDRDLDQGGSPHGVRRFGDALARPVAARRRGGRPAVVGTLLRTARRPRPPQAAVRAAPRGRRGGRGPQRLRQLLPPGRGGALPPVARP